MKLLKMPKIQIIRAALTFAKWRYRRSSAKMMYWEDIRQEWLLDVVELQDMLNHDTEATP